MVDGKGQATDEVRLSEIAFAAQKIVIRCLEREGGTEGWMTAGRSRFVNITVERLHWDGRGMGTGRGRGRGAGGALRSGGGSRNGTRGTNRWRGSL